MSHVKPGEYGTAGYQQPALSTASTGSGHEQHVTDARSAGIFLDLLLHKNVGCHSRSSQAPRRRDGGAHLANALLQRLHEAALQTLRQPVGDLLVQGSRLRRRRSCRRLVNSAMH